MITPDNISEYSDDGPVEIEDSIEQIIQLKLSNAVRKLREFMSTGNFITEKGDPRTNIINNAEKKSYYIPPDNIDEFFTLLEACRKDGRVMNYAERQETIEIERSGLMIDLDVYQKSRAKIVTDEHLKRIVRRIAKLLRETLAFEPNDVRFDFHVFVISRPDTKMVSKGTYKDGYHILIPEIMTIRGYKKYILSEMKAKKVIENSMTDILPQLVDLDKLLDANSAHVPVNFIGSAKAGNEAYPLTHVYHVGVDILDDDVDATLLDAADIADGHAPDGNDINLTYEMSLGFNFEQIDRADVWLVKRHFDYAEKLEGKIQNFVEKTRGNLINDDELEDNENEVDILALGNAEANYLKKLLSILDLSYATEYKKWFEVICAIANTNVRYKPLAIWFSQRKPDSWSPTEVDRVWGEALNTRCNRTPVTKRSIIFWAKESSPERFRAIDSENYINILARTVYQNKGKIEHADAARVVYAMIGDKFVCDSPKNDHTGRTREWYEFVLPEQRHRVGEVYKWRREDDPDILHNFIADQLPRIYDEQIARIQERYNDAQDIGDQKYWAKVKQNLEASRIALGNNTYQNNVVAQCKRRFRARGFTDELDSYENVIGVGNGVLVLGREPKLINGFHEYRVSKFTPVKYRPYNPNNPAVMKMENCMRDIIPEDDARRFIFFYLSTFIDMRPASDVFLIVKGGGQNGKTWMLVMTSKALGEMYVSPFRPELLVGPNEKAQDANSAKMSLANRTGGYCDEFNPGDTFNTSRVKSIVNPSRQTGRELYGTESSFANTVNLIVSTNHDIGTADTDHGFWRRVLYYTAKIKFCENPDPSNKYEKKVDGRYMHEYANDPEYQEAWLSILVHYNTILRTEYAGDIKRVPRPTIARETEIYRDSQDTLNRFINRMIVRAPVADDIGLERIAAKYIDWYNRNINQTKIKVGDVVSLLESSKLHPAIAPRLNGSKVLAGHRMLEAADDELGEGESYLYTVDTPPAAAPGADQYDNVGDDDSHDDVHDDVHDGQIIHATDKHEFDEYIDESLTISRLQCRAEARGEELRKRMAEIELAKKVAEYAT